MTERISRLSSQEDQLHRAARAARQTTSDSTKSQTSSQPSALMTPQRLLSLQRTIGNRAVQRLLEQEARPQRITRSEQPKVTYRPRTVARKMIQRNIFHKMAKPLSKYMTLGSDSDRRSVDGLDQVKQDNRTSFSDIQDVSVPNGAHTLKGRYYLAKQANALINNNAYRGFTVLFLSGSGGSAETYSLPLAKTYCYEGANVLAVNYRGFGQSTMRQGNRDRRVGRDMITEDGLYSDARAMFNWLATNGVAANKVIVHGFSLGGAMASHLVADLAEDDIRVGGLVMHSPIDSVRSQAVSASKRLGGFAAKAGGLELDSIENLRRLSRIPGFANLAIHFMTGGDPDHLGLAYTQMQEDARGMGFTDVSATAAEGADHLNSASHMEVAVRGGNRRGNAANSVNRLFPQDAVQGPVQDAVQEPVQDAVQEPSVSDVEAQMPQEEASNEELAETQQAAKEQPGKVHNLISMFEEMGGK